MYFFLFEIVVLFINSVIFFLVLLWFECGFFERLNIFFFLDNGLFLFIYLVFCLKDLCFLLNNLILIFFGLSFSFIFFVILFWVFFFRSEMFILLLVDLWIYFGYLEEEFIIDNLCGFLLCFDFNVWEMLNLLRFLFLVGILFFKLFIVEFEYGWVG